MDQLSLHTRLIAMIGAQRWLLLGPFTLSALLSLLLLVQAGVTSQIFVRLFAQPVEPIGGLLVALAVLLLLRPLLMIGRELVSIAALTRIKRTLRNKVLQRMTARGPVPLARERTGTVTALVVDGVENLDAYYARYIPQLGVVGFTAAIVVTALFFVDPVVAIAVGLCAVLVPLLPRLWDRALERRGSSHWEAYSSLHADFVDSLQAMPTIKAIGAVRRRHEELAKSSNELLTATMSQLKISLIESGISAFALVVGPLVALVASLVQIERGALEPSQIFFIGLLSIELFRPFRELSNHWHAGYLGTFAGQEIHRALHAALPAQPDEPQLLPADRDALPVDLEDLEYHYPESDSNAIQRMTLHIDAGEKIGIVGPSGSGKSTLAALMVRFILPTVGHIRIGGVSTADSDQQSCLAAVTLVPQSPVLFHGTLRENLLEAVPSATQEELEAVIEATELSQLVPGKTPEQVLDRDIGERGSLLSGGQRQRVAIARALLRKTPVMILDEATSALDLHSERRILDVLDEQLPGQTRIVIAHRLASTRTMDRVVVVNSGRISESGPPAELLSANGEYANLMRQQNQSTYQGAVPDPQGEPA